MHIWGKLLAGPPTRTSAIQRRYVKYLKNVSKDRCIFCHFATDQPENIVENGTHTLVVTNTFPYTVWDGCTVVDHLMIFPKKHRISLAELSNKELAEWSETCAHYEAIGYSTYTRSPDNITKSIGHSHTHLIKLGSKRKSFMIYLRKPHTLLMK